MTSELPKPIPPAQALLRLNRALDDQVKMLVKTEQRLYRSQRDLAQRNARLDALNRFALEAAELADPHDVLRRAVEVLCSVFALDQAVGFLAGEPGTFAPVVALGLEGGALETEDVAAPVRPPVDPLIDRGGAIRSMPELSPVLAVFDRLFGEAEDDPAVLTVVVPLVREGGRPVGLLVLRRPSAVNRFHEELPSQADVGFLRVVARLTATHVTNAQLLRDLKVSYEELARAQHELVDRERLAALGELAAIVAHEIRNPLGVIFNVVAILGKQQSSGEGSAGLLDILREEAERLERIVSDLIDFASPHPPRRRPEELLPVVESAVETARAWWPTAQILIVADGDVPEVLADARMLRRAILNLLVNAVQAASEQASVTVRLHADARLASVAIEDCGPGVPTEIAERIFDPFFTTKATGPGLGLSVVKRVADAHDGSIVVSDRPGGGSVFTLTLPVVPHR